MAKRKVIRNTNRPFTYNPHYYSWGGDLLDSLNFKDAFNLKDTFSGANVGNMLKGGISGAAGSLVGKVGGNLIGGGLESGAGSAISNIGGTIGGAVGAVSPLLGGIVSAGSGIIGGLVNRMFGSKLNKENIAEIESDNKRMNTLMVDSSNFDTIENQWGTQNFGEDFSKSDIGKDGWFSNKAKNKFKELQKQQNAARNRALTSFENATESADIQSDLNVLGNFAAYGGPLDIWGYGGGAIGYELAKENLNIKEMDALNKSRITSLPNSFSSPKINIFAKGGGIHIKPENRGKFTEYCGGKVTSECIAKGKRSSNPAVRKRATFAANARKWHHAEGGELFTNGVTIIGNGGTHEENPYEGVQMGIDPQGIPNLVEEGEVVFNDYVFSNRLIVPDAVREKYKLRGNKELTFADAAKQVQKESKERPNDPISKRGLMSAMSRLQQEQEAVREEKQASQEGRQYAKGGKLGNLTWLRYAPVVGSAIGLGQNLFSSPDYSNADTILEAAENAGTYTPVGFDPIGNYLQYNPLDRNFYINKLNAQAGATRRAIMNTTSPSRNAALLAADYNAQGRLGDLARQAEEYNLAQRQAIETFNRGTNMANAEMGLKAAMANQEAAMKAAQQRLAGTTQAMNMREEIAARRGAGISANLTNFFNSLGEIGREEYSRNMIMSNPALYYSIDSKGNITYKNGYEDLSEAEKKEVRTAASKAKSKKAKGGYLTIKKGGRHG